MSDEDVLESLDFPVCCNGCRHPSDGHTGPDLKCMECSCSRSNPGGFRDRKSEWVGKR